MADTIERDEVIYSDHETLMEDFQVLLSDVALSDSSVLVSNSRHLALHSQVLRARSHYFDALLGPRWAPISPAILQKPNVPADVFQDLLEFLVTGAVTLCATTDAIQHNLSLACLAHEVACDELERLVVRHIRSHMTLDNITLYVRAVHAMPSTTEADGVRTPPPLPPETVQEVFLDCLVWNINKFSAALAGGEWPVMRTLWCFLANAQAAGLLYDTDISRPIRSIMEFSHVSKGKLLRVQDYIKEESTDDRSALLSFLLEAPPAIFMKYVEPRGLYSKEELLKKYRADALRLSTTSLQTKQRPKYRILCESEHPHRRGARLATSVRKVVVPTEKGSPMADSLLIFDSRSCLGGGSELAFYTKDPATGVHPYAFRVGRDLRVVLTLPGSEFWYAFASPDEETDSDEYAPELQSQWGWRFFVEAIPPELDSLD